MEGEPFPPPAAVHLPARNPGDEVRGGWHPQTWDHTGGRRDSGTDARSRWSGAGDAGAVSFASGALAHYAEDSNPVPSGKPPSNPSRHPNLNGGCHVLADGIPGQTCPAGHVPLAASCPPVAYHFYNSHSEHLLVCHHLPSVRSVAMAADKAPKGGRMFVNNTGLKNLNSDTRQFLSALCQAAGSRLSGRRQAGTQLSRTPRGILYGFGPFYNNRPTSPPTGIAEPFPTELSGCRS